MPGAKDLFYMKQTIGNACGTIAIIHSISNNTSSIKPSGCNYRMCAAHSISVDITIIAWYCSMQGIHAPCLNCHTHSALYSLLPQPLLTI